MKNILSGLVLLFLLVSCNNTNVQKETSKPSTNSSHLTHMVYLKVKTESIDSLIKELDQLRRITSIDQLTIGQYKDLEDPRALSDYNILMQMHFKDQTAYNTYQKDSIHSAVKASTKKYLKGPPLTYHFEIK